MALISFAQLPTTVQQNVHHDQIACENLDTFMRSLTNNSCILSQGATEKCNASIEKVIAESPYMIEIMVQHQVACKNEMMQNKPEAVLKHLQHQYKDKRCDRRMLSAEDRYLCNKIKNDMKELSDNKFAR